ncbi:hypothetical protein [Coleofasciculus sp. G3-WIS-01]|uniref:hypothetical protein n=1 Tax=unclassified Coleofasciculus TaxID=2692782 RepID=UPI0032F95E09
MRLKKSKNAAEEELVMFINEGYEIVNFMNGDYQDKLDNGTFDSEKDNERKVVSEQETWMDMTDDYLQNCTNA